MKIQRISRYYLIGILIAGLLISNLIGPNTIFPQTILHSAYGDGLAFETLQPTFIGGRPLALFIKIDPTILTDIQSAGSASLYIRLFDVNNNQTARNVSYSVKISKDDSGLLEEKFNSIPGPLSLNFRPEVGKVRVIGQMDPKSGWWLTDEGKITIHAPIALVGGLYKVDVSILKLQNEQGDLYLSTDDAPTFTSWLSIGDIVSYPFVYSAISYNTTVISYYEKVSDFGIDATVPAFYWSMPFNWDLERILNQTIFVHEEIKIPKSFISRANSSSFAASVNGIFLTPSALAVDPYSSESDMTVHIILPKAALIELATIIANSHTQMLQSQSDLDSRQKDISNYIDKMNFSFVIKTNLVEETAAKTSSSVITDSGFLGLIISWSDKSQLSEGTSQTMKISFFDVLNTRDSGIRVQDPERLPYDVRYDLAIFDANGRQILNMTDLVAQGGKDLRTVLFPGEDEYHLKVRVTGVRTPQSEDWSTSMNGTAFGVVVVPEFVSIHLILLSALFVITITARRQYWLQKLVRR